MRMRELNNCKESFNDETHMGSIQIKTDTLVGTHRGQLWNYLYWPYNDVFQLTTSTGTSHAQYKSAGNVKSSTEKTFIAV
jgi:hypothetical protein